LVPPTLKSTVGTSLDKGVELDALAKLPAAERDGLAKRAAAGEEVSARATLSRAKREQRQASKTKIEPQQESQAKIEPQNRRDEILRATLELSDWNDKHSDLWKALGIEDRMAELSEEMGDVAFGADDILSGRTNEPPKEGKLRNWLKGRKGD
jgi:hypothetical protein